MSKGILDGAKIAIPCPACGEKTEKTVGWLKAHDHFTCSACGGLIAIEKEQLLAGLKGVGDALRDFRKALGHAGKRRK